ncbi:MAG: hypothetical protein QOI95_1975 [Acidimicrobiaceae bacterium]
MPPWRSIAALNNAEWCNAVCLTHGAQTTVDEVAWTSRTRTPPYYPDAVTLAPDVAIPELLARIDSSAGCSIKDSYAALDLAAHGFEVLFDAEWIVRTSGEIEAPETSPRWEVVRNAAGLEAWEQAWRGHDGASGIFRAELLDDDTVVVIGARSSAGIVAGAVLNRSRDAVGISNFFSNSGAGPSSWGGCLALAGALFPASPLVGYASGSALDAARAHGFATAGPLRVWLRKA